MSPTTMVFQERLRNPIASKKVCPVSAIIFQALSEQSLRVCVWAFGGICPAKQVPVSGREFLGAFLFTTWYIHAMLGAISGCTKSLRKTGCDTVRDEIFYFISSVSVCFSAVLPSGSYLRNNFFFFPFKGLSLLLLGTSSSAMVSKFQHLFFFGFKLGRFCRMVCTILIRSTQQPTRGCILRS